MYLSNFLNPSSWYQPRADPNSSMPAEHDVTQGRSILERIYFTTEHYNPIEDEKEIIHIMNLLYQKAKEKEQTFDEGAYFLEDPDEKLFKALKTHGYPRISSHYAGGEQSEHYGIDFPEGAWHPLGKRHISFHSSEEINGSRRLFLKPENYGTRSTSDLFSHGIEYIESCAKRADFLSSETGGKEHRKERLEYLTGEGKNC